MKKKLLIIMMVMVMSMLSIACGKKQEESLGGETSVEVTEETKEADVVEDNEESTEEQAANVEEFSTLTEDENTANNVQFEEGEEKVAKTKLDIFFELFGALFYGEDEAGNSYYYMTKSDDTYAALIIVSGNGEESLNIVGACTYDGVGSYTITGENGKSVNYTLNIVSEGLLINLEDGRSVTTSAMIDPELVDKAMDYIIVNE